MRKTLLLGLIVAGAFVSTAAQAVPIFGFRSGFQSYAGPIEIKFQNFENVGFIGVGDSGRGTNFDLAKDATVFGVLRVTSIETPGGDQIWGSGDNSAFISGVFRQTVTSVAPNGSGGFNYEVGAGAFDFYLNTVALNAQQGLTGYAAAGGGCLPGALCYNTVSNDAGGALFLSTVAGSGINPGNGAVTFSGNVQSTFPTTGTFQGYMDITGGLYQAKFDTNGQITPLGNRDFFAQGNVCPNNALGGPVTCGPVSGGQALLDRWQLISNDPVRGNVIPEPGSLALLGIVAVGVAGFTRRTKRVS